MTSCPEVMGRDSWVFWKKQSVDIWTKMSPVVWCRVRALGGIRWNGQHSKNCVSISSCRKPKSQEGNKSFIPEPRESSVFRVFRDSYAYERFTYIYIFHESVSWLYYNWVIKKRNRTYFIHECCLLLLKNTSKFCEIKSHAIFWVVTIKSFLPLFRYRPDFESIQLHRSSQNSEQIPFCFMRERWFISY